MHWGDVVVHAEGLVLLARKWTGQGLARSACCHGPLCPWQVRSLSVLAMLTPVLTGTFSMRQLGGDAVREYAVSKVSGLSRLHLLSMDLGHPMQLNGLHLLCRVGTTAAAQVLVPERMIEFQDRWHYMYDTVRPHPRALPSGIWGKPKKGCFALFPTGKSPRLVMSSAATFIL